MLSEKSMDQLVKIFDDTDRGDIYDWVRLIGLPKCDYSLRIAHRVRSTIMSIKYSNSKGFKGIAKMDYQNLKNNLLTLEENTPTLILFHQAAAIVDKAFDTTH